MAQQKIKVDLSGYGLSSDEKEQVADLIIERIVNRTDKGKDKNNIPFVKYSPAYKESLDFKNAGKSKNGPVNLQLSGDMLAAIKIIGITSRSATIGFEAGTPENGKAEGNIKGTYGQSSPIVGKARDFLGISDEELLNIIAVIQNDKPKGRAI